MFKTLQLEEIRAFFVRRPWFHGSKGQLLTESQYECLRDRKPNDAFTAKWKREVSIFIEGYKSC